MLISTGVLRAARLLAGGLGLSSMQVAECARQPEALLPGSVCAHRIVVVGGGSAGVTVAAQLLRQLGAANANLAVIEPADDFDEQPRLALIGDAGHAAEGVSIMA